jgi:hypothetical protein
MGLPNIKKNSDWMDIQSKVNEGTVLRFKVYLGQDPKRGK